MTEKNNKKNNKFYSIFFYILIGLIVAVGLYIFRPFLMEIAAAAMLASVSFPIYRRLLKILKGRKSLTAFLVCLLWMILVIVPVTQLIIYTAQQAPAAFARFSRALAEADSMKGEWLSSIGVNAAGEEIISDVILSVSSRLNNWIISASAGVALNTGKFVISWMIILLGIFYFLRKGPEIGEKIASCSFLPRKYNLEIIASFRESSRTTLLSLLAAAFVQGLLSALGFMVIGWPFFFIFIISAFLSMIPYALGLFYLPIIFFLFASGQIWQALLIIVWNLIIVVNVDELIRARIAKGGSQVNMVFMIFAILGGISLFGFWGIFFGPLIVSLSATILDIYGREFSGQLQE